MKNKKQKNMTWYYKPVGENTIILSFKNLNDLAKYLKTTTKRIRTYLNVSKLGQIKNSRNNIMTMEKIGTELHDIKRLLLSLSSSSEGQPDEKKEEEPNDEPEEENYEENNEEDEEEHETKEETTWDSILKAHSDGDLMKLKNYKEIITHQKILIDSLISNIENNNKIE